MRRLIVCCDGTWQNVAQDSNVSRLHAAIVTPAGDPEPLYIKGVGVSRSPVDAVRGGLTGAGLSESITDGYRWVARHFRPGDRLAIFGFSRGAYSARSLAGMIGRVGLIRGAGLGARELEAAVDRAYARYRTRRPPAQDPGWSAGLEFVYRAGEPDIPVDFIGVWDTVGALGIPSYVGIPDFLGSRKRYEFLDVVLNRHIAHGRHAVSLDEMRAPFRPTLWRDIPPDQDVQQVWFPGDHSDVGGGHRDKGLSDGALDWMMRETTAAIGVPFDRGRIPGFRPDFRGQLHGGWQGPAGAVFEVAMQPRPRATPRVDRRRPDPAVDGSAYDRQRTIGYRATRTLARRGDSAEVTVPAQASWTSTGLYLEPGAYRVVAAGTWRSARRTCGPGGDTSMLHLSGGSFSKIIGVAQSALRRLLRNPEAEVPGARREPAKPWMALIGLVANEDTDAAGRTLSPDQRAFVGSASRATVLRPGYLYAFPNDAWGFYGNNGGSVEFTITRL